MFLELIKKQNEVFLKAFLKLFNTEKTFCFNTKH